MTVARQLLLRHAIPEAFAARASIGAGFNIYDFHTAAPQQRQHRLPLDSVHLDTRTGTTM
jgi:hypothetical protein